MVIILVRTLLLYIFVLIALRLMGKGQLSEMQPFELVIILMIAELASLPMEETGVPLINGFIAISTLLFLQVTISYLNLKSEKIRRLICGKPSILINHGKINEKELKRLRITINDLVEQLRIKDYANMADVEFAILETNGDLSVIPKPEKRPPTLGDLNIAAPFDGLPVTLVIDGQILYDNLQKLDVSKDWLMDQLHMYNVKDPEEVLFSYIDASKNIYVHKKSKG
ncbi:YetF domain-containing protein [Inediibacterium massiliense]|uniref:YetF domain-containing protein n=1 Tax=Inediibacterium massiliense TaxID=1658111 RepID=UPI0006B587C5|nr:DUF421 domain-containing protein [Inediibacterium massiliense]